MEKTIMAHAPLPKLVPIGSPRIVNRSDFISGKSAFAEVLKSEPVKRLLSQPNIVLKAIFKNATSSLQEKPKIQITTKDIKLLKNPPIAVSIPDLPNAPEGEHLLPSKNDGHSEISLERIQRKRKKCGHFEPCENLICDVNVEQFEDKNGLFPMVAFHIKDFEINARVTKHCNNPNCDALSIDHNRCRRGIIRLYRYDKSNCCDICGMTLKTRRSRIGHKNCRRKEIYQHNTIDSSKLLKIRMRERELQMLEALRIKRSEDYDPLSEENVIETLSRNSDLIVIPKRSVPEPIVTIREIPKPSLHTINSNTINASEPVEKILPTISVVLPSKINENFDNSISQSKNNINHTPKSHVVNLNNSIPQQTLSYPLNINDWVMSQQGTATSPKPILMPVRIVPIANLRSEPSLMHQQQGVPRFCIVADNSLPPQTYVNVQGIQTLGNHATISPVTISEPPPLVTSLTPVNFLKPVQQIKPAPAKKEEKKKEEKKKEEKKKVEDVIKVSTPTPRSGSRYIRKLKSESKPFQCQYCNKRFLTNWYFKCHIARHKGDMNSKCDICGKAFTNNYDVKKHMTSEHNDQIESNKLENDEEMMEDNIYMENDCVDVFEETTIKIEPEECIKVVPKFKIINVNGVRRTSMRHSSDDEDGRLIIDDESGLDSEKDHFSDADMAMDGSITW